MPAPRRRSNRRLFTTSAFGALALAAVWAAPAHAQLVQGATPAQSNGTGPTIDQSVPNTTTVTLGGSRTVIDWDKFDINSGDTANFVFANRSDIVLNRVGGAGSTINGNLNGTIGSTGGAVGGNIWIYNANGVVIGANARVSTGGLLVTTAGLDRATDSSAGGFLDGTSTSFGFTGSGTGNITVQNGAQITSHGGAIALVAPVVTAEAGSSLSAQDGGNVLVGSAAKYQISFRPTSTDDMDLLSFEVADGAGTSGADAISLAGNISGNRVFVAAVSKSGLTAGILNTGTITATTAVTDETGAIVLSANHDIVNGAAAAAPLSGIGEGYVTTIGGSVTGPKVDFVASENVLLRSDVGETGAVVGLRSDNTDIRQFQGVITADTLTASAQTGINFNSFSANRVDKLGALSTATGDLTYLGDEDGVILTGAVSAPGKVTLGVRGFMDTTTGSISAGSLELFLGGGGSFKVNGDANLTSGMSNGAVTVHATGGITLANEFAMNLGNQLSLTADTGAIRETGGFISGGGAVVANAAGEIDLRGANSFTSLTANSADGENITVNATGNLDFKVNTFSSARFTVGGDATSSGTNALIAGGLHVTAGGAINLSSDGGDAAFGDLQANGNITLAMDGVLRLGGVIQANGGTASFTSRSGAIQQSYGSITADAISFDADSTISQTNGAFVQTGGLSLTSGGTATLGSANSFTSIQNLHVGGDLTLRNAGNINLEPTSSGGYTSGGVLSLVSDTGNITDSNANPIIASKFSASAGGYVSINGTIDILGDVIAPGGVTIFSGHALALTGNISGATVNLIANSMTQAAGTSITATSANIQGAGFDQDSSARISVTDTLEILAADILLRGANDFGSNDPLFLAGNLGTMILRSVGGFTYRSYSSNLAALTLISDTGSITQAGGLNAGTLTVRAATGINLSAPGGTNAVTTVNGLTTTSGGITFTEGDGFDIAGDISAPGLVQLGTSGAINTNSGHLSAGTLEVTAGGGASFDVTGNIKLGDVSTGGGNFYLGSNGNIELTGAIATGASNLILATTNGAITSNGGTISAWLTMADATGAISLVGSGYANFWANSSGGGAIHLSGNNDVGFQANTTGALTVDAGGQAYNSGDVVANTVSITAGTGINLVNTGVTVDIGSFSHLAADDGLVSVDIAGDINLDGDVTAGGTGNTVSLRSGGSILQNSGTITGDIIKLSGAAAITQASGATLDGGALSLTSSGNVSLGEANSFTSIADLTVGGDLTLRNLGSIDLDPTNSGGFSSGGKLTLTSDTGDISAGNVVTTSKLTATALNGSILLGGGGHLIGSLGTLKAGGDIEIGTDVPGFTLTGDITATNVTLLAMNGGITQNAGTRITAGTLYATANNNITLDQANAITTVGGLNANLFTSGHNITFRNDGAIILNGRVDATGGTLRLTSNTGGITQNNGATIYLRASQLFLNAAGYTELNSTSNNVATIGGITNTNFDTQYQDADGFDVAGNLNAGAIGGIILRAGNNGAITQSAGIVSAGAFGAQGGTVTFTRANQFANLLQTQGVTSVTINTVGDLAILQGLTGDTISLTSGGAITQGGSSYVNAHNTLNLSAVTGIDLWGGTFGANNIINLGTLTNTTSGGIRIVTNNGGYGTTLAGNISAAGQTVSISDELGAISQTGGVITADTLNLSATAGISATSANAVTNLGTLSAGGASAFTNAGSFNLTDAVTTGGNALTLTSQTGAITQTGGTITASAITAAAATGISLEKANDITAIGGLSSTSGDILYRTLGDIIAPAITTAGTISLTSDTGSVSQTGALTANALVVIAQGGITLDNAANNVAQIGNTTIGGWIARGGVITYVDADGFNLGWIINSGVHTLSLTAGGTGSIGQNANGGYIVAHTFNASAGGSITLDNANGVTVLGNLTAGGTGDIVFRAGSSLYLSGNITAGTGGDVTLTNTVGAITQNGGRITADKLTVNAVGNIILDQAANDFDRLGASRSQNGDVTIRDTDAFDITGQVQAAGALSLTSGNAITTNGGLVVAGGLLNVSATSANLVAGNNVQLGTVTTNGNFAIDTDGNLTVTGLLNTNGGDATLTANFGTIGRGASGTISANKVTATARDSITLDSTGNAVVWASSSNGGDINLTGNADIFFKIDTTGDLTVDAGGIAGNNDSVIANSVGINAAGGVYLNDQTVTIDVGSYRYLTSSAGAIDVENQGDINLDGNVTASGGTGSNYVRLNSSGGSLLQNSGTISGYSVELDAAQSVLQDASAKVVAGDYGLSFRATDVSLLGANEIPSINTYTVTHDLTLRAVGTIDMSGSANQAGSNHYTTLISDTGNIIGGPINADRLSATATNGKLVFTYGNNHIGSLGALTAKNTGGTDIDIFSDSLLGLTGNIAGGGVNIYAVQGINQTGGAITADRLFTGTSGDLLLGGANNFGQLLDFGHGNGKNVTIRNLGSITLPGTPNSFGTLTLTSDAGSINQTSAIVVGTLIANAATGITLTQANNFTTLDGLVTAAGNIRIADTNGFAIEGDITAPGTVALASGGNITTGTTTVGIVTTPHGKVDADTLTVSAVNATVYTAGDIKLGTSSVSSGFTLVADGSIDLTATSNFFAASLIANTGSITQSAGILTGNTVLTGAAGSITLDKANNLSSFGGTSQGGGTVTFNNAGTSTLDLTVSTTGNAVVTTAGGVLGAYIRAGDLSLTAGGAIDLTFNTDVNSVSKLVATSGSIRLTDANSFQITGDVTAGSGTLGTVDLRASAGAISQFDGTITGDDVHLTGTGNLNQVGAARIVANTIALSGYSLQFGGANSFNSTGSNVSTAANGGLILRNAGSIDLDALGGYTSGGSLGLTSDNGSITSTGAIDAVVLSAAAEHGTVSFGNAGNSFSYLGTISASGDATITTSSTSLVLLNDIGVGGRLTLGAQGAITQSNVTLTAASLYATAGGTTGAITLGAANDIGTLGALTADGDVYFHDINGFQIAGNVRGDHVSLIADAGAIRENSGTVIANHLTASAVDGLVLSQVGNQIHTIDGLTNSSNATNVGIAIASDVDMHLAGNVTAPGQYVYFFVGNGALVQDSGTITGGYLRLRLMNGSATLGAGNALDNLDSIWIDGGDFTANSNLSAGMLGLNGNILVSGTTTITNAAGITQGPGGVINTYNLNLRTAGQLDMGNVINIVGGQANIAMGSGSFLSYGDLNLQLNATGAATITSGGNINFTGVSSSSAGTLTLSAVNGIYSDAGAGGQIAVDHLGTVTNSGSGGIALNLLGNVALEGDITAAGQTVSLTAEDGLSQATGNVITASRLNVTTTAPNASAILDNANIVGTFGLNVTGDATLRSTLATTIASGMSVGGALTVNSPGDIVMAGGSVGGTLALYAGGAVNGTGYVSANRLTGSAEDHFYLNFTNLNTLDSVESGSDIQINASSSNLDIIGDITAAGGIELSGHTLNQSAGTIATGANSGIGLSTDGAITQTGTGRIIAKYISAIGGDISLIGANQVGATGNYLSSGGTSIAFRNTGSIDANADFRFYNGRGALTLISDTGAITQSAAIDATSVTLRAATGIDFGNPANTIDAIAEATNGTTGGITLANGGNLVLTGAVTATNQAVLLSSANGAVSQNSAGIVFAQSLGASAQTGVQLHANNNIREITGLSNAGSGGISFNNYLGYELTGNVTAAGQQVTLDSTYGGLTQSGGIITAGNITSSAEGLIRLDMANNVGSGTASSFSSSNGNIFFHSANAILLGTVNAPGLLSLTADSGDITQTVAISANRLTASAVGGDIVLDQLNSIGTLNAITALDGFSLRTSTGLTLDGEITAHDLVKLVAGGDITQVGAGAIHSDFLETTSGVGAANGISLLNHNQVGQATLNSNGKDLRFRNVGDFELGNISAAGHIVEMISDTGSVTQLAGTSILAGTFSATGTNVVLDNTGNQISRIGLISTGSDLSLRNGVALQIDAIDAGSHNVTITNSDNLTGGNITAGTLTLNLTGGYVDLTTANHVASLGGFNGYQLSFTNDESFTISGAIQNGMYQSFLTSQTGAISMAGGAVNSGAVTLQAATGISITGNLSYVYGATTTSGDVSLLSSLLDIQGDIRGDTVTLGGTANGGFVRQTSGVITANLLNASGYGSVTLDGTANHIAALGTLSSSFGDVIIKSLDAVALTGNIDASSYFSLDAGGAVDQTGGRINAGWLYVNAAGDVTLDAANLVNSGGDVWLGGDNVTFVNDGTFTVAGIDAGTTGAIDLTSLNGNIWQSNAMSGGSLTASAHGSLSLNQGNAIDSVGALSAGTELTYASATNYQLTGDLSAGTTVSLNGGSITQAGGKITAQTLEVNAANANLQSYNAVGRLGTITAGSFVFINSGDIELWGTVNTSTLSLLSLTGGVSNPGGLFTTDHLNVMAADNIQLLGGTFNYIDYLKSRGGDITLTTSSNVLGATLISAENGTVDLTVGRITADAVSASLLNVDAGSGDIELIGNNEIDRLGYLSGDNISLAVGQTAITGYINANNSIAFVRSGLATDFALGMGSNGALRAQMISLSNTGSAGTATLTGIIASSSQLELNLNFNGNASVTTSVGGIYLNNAVVDGDLYLRGYNAITTSGAHSDISGTISAQNITGDISLNFGTDTVGHFGDILTGSGYIGLGAASVDLTGVVQAGGGSGVFLSAANGSVTQASGSTITAANIQGMATGDFLLTGANHISVLGTITATNGDIAVATDRSLTIDGDVTTDRNHSISLISTLASGPAIQNSGTGVLHTGTLNIQAIGDVVLTNQDILRLGLIDPTLFSFSQAADFDITADIVADAVQLTSTGGQITQSGGVITTSSATLSAQAGISLLGNNRFGTLSLSTMTGDIGINNVGDLVLTALASPGNASVTVTGGGSLTIGSPTVTAAGDLSLEADSFVSITSAIDAGGDVSVTSHNGAVSLFTIRAGDDIAVSAATAVSIVGASIGTSGVDNEADDHNMLFSGSAVTLGAVGPASISADNALEFNGWTGSAAINAGAGGAAVNLYRMDNALSIATVSGAVQAQVDTGDLMLGTISGGNVLLRSVLGSVNATGVSVTGDYTLWSGAGFNVGALSPCGCGIVNLTITQDNGNLFLPTSIGAFGNIQITVSGGALDAAAGVQLGAVGDVDIHAGNIGIGGISGGNVTLVANSGMIDVRDFLLVANDYTLTGSGFAGEALAPIGTRGGTWTLTSLGALDMGGRTLEYDGDIDFSVAGLLGNGTIQSLSGAVKGSAGSANVYELLARTDIDVSTTGMTGGLTVFHAAAANGSATLRSSQAVNVSGSIEAGANVGISAQFGAATVGNASAGGDISVYSLFGNATLRQATLTGSTGGLTVQSVIGTAKLGADDYASITGDHYFERAAGSTGTVSILGSAGAKVYLDHSAALDLVQANTAWVEVQHGDLSIDTLAALAGDATAITEAGSIFVNSARGGGLLLEASGGNLTLGGAGITANGIHLVADGTVDTTAIGNLSGQYIAIVGSTIRAASLSSSGDADLSSTNGGITLDRLTASGTVFVSALGDLTMNQVSVGGLGTFVADGEATVRGVIASNGFLLTGQGNVTLGADAGATATADNYIQVGGTLGGCGCFTGGATVISLGGNVSVNLTGATGVFDRVTADAGNISIANASGDLGINLLRGHNILVSTPGQLGIVDAQSSGGRYALTAADFGTFTLSPSLFGGATSLGDVTIIDTDGNLNSTGSLHSSGDVHVEARGGAITGGLSLIAAGDVTAIGQGVALQWAEGRDVTIDAGTGTAGISNTLSIGRDYTVTAGDFSGNALAATGTKTGALAIVDTVGDFDFGSTDLAFGGAIDIDASHGLLNIGNLQAGNAITLNAGGNLSLASAALTSTGTNSFSLVAGGDLRFGAANAASIGGTNVFSNAGSLASGTSIQADGNLAINLHQADSVGAIEGGTVQIAVAAGDFTAGDIDAVGALSVQGPGGTLTLGDLTTSAGHINVSGQGNTTLGDVSANFVVNLGASMGNLSVGTVTGGDVSFMVAGGINAASVSAGTLGVVAVNGDADLDHGGTGSHVASLGTVTVNNGGLKLRNLRDLSLDGIIEVNGTLDLQVAGGLSQNAWYIVAGRLQGNATGAVTLGGDNRIGTLGAFASNGFKLSNAAALSIDGAVQAGTGSAVIASHGGMAIAANGSVSSSASGDAITLASDGRFTNLAGAGALDAANGRWLVYTQAGGNPGTSDPLNDFGGLAGTSYYGDAYNFGAGSFATAPNAGNRFVYGYRPVLTVTPSSLHLVYDGTVPNVTTTVTGLVHGDSAGAAWSGAAAISGVGSDAGTYFAYASLGTLSSEMGYSFAFVPGTVVIDPRVISAILTANDRSYDGTLGATGTLGLSGVIAGDTVSANSAGMAFDDRNAGTRTVTANGITLSGADAGNYVLAATSVTDLADILAKAITATLSANGKTYDGTTAATGSLSLGGLVGNDQVSATGSYAFDSRNAGTRTVTASGIALSGADAGNYVLTGTSATALADILAKAVTATLSANGKTYDGTTAATGSLSLGGLVGNDQVSAAGTYAFDSRNAGTRTVTASGIGLSGADAGNYVLASTSTTALADILAKAITATLSANGKTYDGTAAATGTLALNGVVAGDVVAATGTGMAFDSKNAGTGRTVTASGIALSGGDAGNYVLTGTTATALADILAKAITATLAANGRVYDGTTAATGTLGLNGVVAGDTVGVTAAGLAFDSRNAGTRTATATGLALNGADAANYTISGTAIGSAVISPKAITATATADSRTYDGTTAATGRIALTGLISGDTVTGTASYRFADANAGTGRTVQVSGLALSGADAANYSVTLSGMPVTADIARRAVTVTVTDMSKILGQPDPAFAYVVTGGSVVSGDSFGGALARAAGEQAGRYAIGQGTLALSANYLLTVIPGTLAITLTQSGAEASDALKTLRAAARPGFSLDQNPSRNLEGDDQGEGKDDGGK